MGIGSDAIDRVLHFWLKSFGWVKFKSVPMSKLGMFFSLCFVQGSHSQRFAFADLPCGLWRWGGRVEKTRSEKSV
jgi:hypothetical protein